MNLRTRDLRLLTDIFALLAEDHSNTEIRQILGQRIMELLQAQYFASYLWRVDEKIFDHRIAFNMTDANLINYEKYFQYCDPITPTLQKRRKATCVSTIISRERLLRTEFFNDFLARDGLWYGINYFAYAGHRNIGDLRVWRDRKRDDFTARDVELLQLVGAAYTGALVRALRQEGEAPKIGMSAALARNALHYGLTSRERTIYSALANGWSDKEIAEFCGISHTTVRTHLKHIYEKTNISSRARILAALMQEESPLVKKSSFSRIDSPAKPPLSSTDKNSGTPGIVREKNDEKA